MKKLCLVIAAFGCLSFAVPSPAHAQEIPGKVTGGGEVADTHTFALEARQDLGEGPEGQCVVLDRNDKVRAKCITVEILVAVPPAAFLFGQAEVNGVVEPYLIFVSDLDESGIGNDSFQFFSSSLQAGGALTAGNIQVHMF